MSHLTRRDVLLGASIVGAAACHLEPGPGAPARAADGAPAPTPTPRHPCPHCGSADFARLRQARVEIYRGGVHQASTCPTFTMLMCTRCGRTDWFADPAVALDYFGGLAERVSAPG